MYTPHALFQAHRVPGDVEVHHQPAELQVDALACRFGRDHYLRRFFELPFGENTATHHITVTNFHAAVDHGQFQTPVTKFAEGASVLAVTGKIIQSVLVLGEDQ